MMGSPWWHRGNDMGTKGLGMKMGCYLALKFFLKNFKKKFGEVKNNTFICSRISDVIRIKGDQYPLLFLFFGTNYIQYFAAS